MNIISWFFLKRKFRRFGSNSSVILPVFIKNPKYISIGNEFNCLWNTRIEAWDSYFDQKFTPEISIGNNVKFNSDIHIGCINKIIIHDNVLLASRIFISDHSHGAISREALNLPPLYRPLISKGPVIIEENVWIGEGVSIMPGVTIGRNCIIGANSVVTKSIKPNSVIGGVPARVLKVL